MRLVANPDYWDTKRGPHLQEVVFRNDLSTEQALEMVCTGEGEVDIVTEVPPSEAARVEASEHARLVSGDAIRIIAGIINRDAEGPPLGDQRARLALNLAIDRDALIDDAMFGHATPLAGLVPRAAVLLLDKVMHPLFRPYGQDIDRARNLWREATGDGGATRPLRIAAPAKVERVGRQVMTDIEAALGISTELTLLRGDQQADVRRRLASRSRPLDWDLLIHEQVAQAADSVAQEMHHAFVGEAGEYRAGPVDPEFETLYAELVAETSRLKAANVTHRMDSLVRDQAFAVFLCAPKGLYAVNRHVDFTPYASTFELAETKVNEDHWSRR